MVGNVNRMSAAIVAGVVFAVSAGAAFATWTSSTTGTTAFTSVVPAPLTPTGVSASFLGCNPPTAIIQVNWTIPGGSGGDQTVHRLRQRPGGPIQQGGGQTIAFPGLPGKLAASGPTTVYVVASRRSRQIPQYQRSLSPAAAVIVPSC